MIHTINHPSYMSYLAHVEIPGLKNAGGGRGDSGGRPDEHVRGGEVVEQPRGVVAIGGCNDDVEDAPGAVEGLLLFFFWGGGGWD